MMATTSLASDRDLNNKLALGAKVGTTGFGVEGRTPIIESLYGRFGVNLFRV